MNERLSYFIRIVIVVLVVGLLVLAVWYQTQLLLCVFAGMLLAILWRGVSRWISSHTPLPYKWAVPLTVLLHLGILVLFGFIAVPKLTEGVKQFTAEAPRILQSLENHLNSSMVGAELLKIWESHQQDLSESLLKWGQLVNVAVTTLGVVVDILLILVFGLFFISDPRLYVRGLLHLVSPEKKDRARQVILCLDNTLFRWFIGKIVDMFSIFVMTILGLWLLDMPLIFTFALIAFFFSFVPNIGPIISALPPIAYALLDSPSKALYVALLYMVIQLSETYFVTPAVQKRASYTPPVLLLFVQFLLGAFAGILGLFLATPLLVTAMVLVKMLYVEDYLNDNSLNTCEDVLENNKADG